MPIRQPIICMLGHVDHGKTSLLDKIRGTSIQRREAGGITQHIGATEVPLDVIQLISGPLIKKFNFNLKIPGLLFIDTPGHEAFTNLRKRGGSIADLAVLVIDITAGIMPQTEEAINILKQFKVPFLVAANKIDLIEGWINQNSLSFLESIGKQREEVKYRLEEKIYNLIAKLSEYGFDSDRFDRISDFTKQVAIIPVSAKTGEGLAELLVLLAGLSQKYLEDKLKINAEGPAKGIILEVKEEKGLGTVIDTIIYDGTLKRGDNIIVGSLGEPIVTKVRALLKPAPLREIREKSKFMNVNQVWAASGVRISAPNLEGAIAGFPLMSFTNNFEEALEFVKKEISSVLFETDKKGIILKADTLGTLEALIGFLKRKGIPIKKAWIGEITKRDVIEAEAIKKEKEEWGVILAFNVNINKEAEELAKNKGVKIFMGNIIYKLVEDYEEWVKNLEEEKLKEILSKTVLPGKIRILPGLVFRQRKPAIVGIEVLGGRIKTGYELMKANGKIVGKILSIEDMGKSLGEAKKGDRVAISIDDGFVGRNIKEGEILYTNMSRNDIINLKKFLKDRLDEEDWELIKEIIEIKRGNNF